MAFHDFFVHDEIQDTSELVINSTQTMIDE